MIPIDTKHQRSRIAYSNNVALIAALDSMVSSVTPLTILLKQ